MDHPERIGQYEIQDVLGEGGMGVVYRATQLDPIKRSVALKVIRAGLGSGVLSRFELERHALALMDHPGIARIYDAGTSESGLPYFAMELVDGEPITDYCDRRRLGFRARIKLFLDLCNAVQHAHQKGVIHRDLKPFNVLVTTVDGVPQPKIIDFGIARALSGTLADRTKVTTEGKMIGTPAYMSPEQAGVVKEDVDTRSDVYALGVILYELLTGVTPMDLSGAIADFVVQYLVGERDIVPPSSRINSLGPPTNEVAERRRLSPDNLRRQLRGDLDWVVMQAIARERGKRYQTVGDFAVDLKRYLRFEPVSAGPGSTAYRARKFIRRHRVGVSSGAAIAVGAILGVVGLGIGLHQARLAEQDALSEAAAAQARELSYRALDRLRANDVVAAHVLAVEAGRTAPVQEAEQVLREVLTQPRPAVIAQLPYSVRDISFSPDGHRFVTWGYDSVAHVMSSENGKLLDVLDIHTGAVDYAAFVSPERAVTVDRTGVLRSWRTVPSRQLRSFRIGTRERNTLFDPVVSDDGSRFAFARKGSVRVYVVEGRNSPPLDAEGETIYFGDFSSDGRLLTGSGGGMDAIPMPGGGHGDAIGVRTVFVWDVESGRTIGKLPGVPSIIYEVFFAPGDSLVVVVGSEVLLWSYRRGHVVRRFPSSGHGSLSMSRDGRRAVLAVRGGTLYDASTWETITRLTEQEADITAGSFSDDGKRFVAAAPDGTVRVWQTETGELEFQLGTGMSGRAVLSPDGGTVLTFADSLSMVWPLGPVGEVARLAEDQCGANEGGGRCFVYSARFRGDGSRMTVLLGDGTSLEWDLQGTIGEPVGEPAQMTYFNDFLPGDSLAVVSRDSAVHVVSLLSGEIRSELNLPRLPHHVSWSADGSVISVTVQDGSVVVWDRAADEATTVASSDRRRLLDAYLNGDGSRLAISWSWGYLEPTGRPRDSSVVELLVLPDGTRDTLFAGPGVVRLTDFNYRTARLLGAIHGGFGEDSSSVAVWDVETINTVAVITGRKQLFATELSPDGRRAVSAEIDGETNLWNVDTGALIAPLPGHRRGVDNVAFAPDGGTVITSGSDGVARVWDAEDGTLLHTFPENSGRMTFHPSGTLAAFYSWGVHVRVLGFQWLLRHAESEFPAGLTETMRRTVLDAGPLGRYAGR